MASQSFTDIFTPVDGDYALISLRRVLGCTVDTIWQGTANASCGQSELIASAASFFNMAVAIVATVLVTYTVWTGIANTASEGEAMGGASTKYTIARVGLGAIMILPVSSGFNLAQILVIQLLVWGSGAADNLWTKASADILKGGYSQMATLPEDDARTRVMLANAIRARAMGYVCAARLNEIAGNSGVSNTIQPDTQSETSVFGWGNTVTTTIGFTDKQSFFNGSTSICGTIQYAVSTEVDNAGSANTTLTTSVDKSARAAMNAIAVKAVSTGISDAMTQVNNAAHSIAQAVLNDARNDVNIKTLILNGVNTSQAALRNAVNSAISNPGSAITELARKYLDATSEAGWAFAITWQRANINVHQYFQSLVSGVTFSATPPENLTRLVQPSTSIGSALWYSPTSSSWRTVTDAYERDVGYLRNFDGYFAGFANESPSQKVGLNISQQDSSGGISGFFRSMIAKLQSAILVTGSDGTSTFVDPLIVLTDIGATISSMGLGAIGGSAVADFFSGMTGPIGSTILGGAAEAAWAIGALLLGMGFWIGGVLPLAPLLYFFGAVMSWLVVGLEAMIAVPIWVLSHFFPAREPSLIGASRQGWLLLFGLLARPVLIVMGLLASVLLMWAGFAILNIMFSSVFALVVPLSSWTVGSTLLSLAAIFMYGVAATIVVSNSCALISELGDAALRWIEIGVQSLWSSRFGSDAMGTLNPASGIGGAGRAMGGMAQGMRRGSYGGAGGTGKALKGLGGRLRGTAKK